MIWIYCITSYTAWKDNASILLFLFRNISVLLDASKNGEVTLIVSYIVSNASWTPLYDVRVFNKENTMQVLHQRAPPPDYE